MARLSMVRNMALMNKMCIRDRDADDYKFNVKNKVITSVVLED